MPNEEIVRELASALLILAHWYETDSGPIEPLDKTRTYLKTFPIGQEVLKEDDENKLDSKILT